MNRTEYTDQQSILSILLEKKFIAIIPHKNPDGDAIASALALKKFINTFHNNVAIFCVDLPPQNTKFLNGTNQIRQDLDLSIYKTLCFVDCGNKEMSNFHITHQDIFDREDLEIINIDHHKSNDYFGKYNIIDTKASSTTEIIYNLFNSWNFKINADIAQDLLTGLHFDTGSFKHPNTTIHTLKVAAKLSSLGANNYKITKNLFHTNSVNQLKLWGQILNNTKINHRKIVSSTVTQKDLKKFESKPKDLEGVIDYLNTIPNKKFAILLTEETDGIKASLRTLSNNYDLNQISKIFGGGGHKMAAGFRIKGKINSYKSYQIE